MYFTMYWLTFSFKNIYIFHWSSQVRQVFYYGKCVHPAIGDTMALLSLRSSFIFFRGPHNNRCKMCCIPTSVIAGVVYSIAHWMFMLQVCSGITAFTMLNQTSLPVRLQHLLGNWELLKSRELFKNHSYWESTIGVVDLVLYDGLFNGWYNDQQKHTSIECA